MKNPWETISQEVSRRYPELDGILECLCVDLITESSQLPQADFVIANLLVEYIGYDSWVSDSPYLHVFDGLEQVHHQMDEQALENTMLEIDYNKIGTSEYILPNGKKLVQLDFKKY